MKTVFKKGMKVYDQLMFPDVEGVVTSTNFIPEKSFFDKEEDFEEDYEHPYPIEVDFKGEQALYKNDGSGFMDFPTLSTKPYKIEFQGFEQKAPAPTYEEVIKEARSKGDYYYLPDCLEAPSEELVDATIALLKLLFLRDYYNEGWVYLENSHSAYIIHTSVENELECSYANGINKVMAFKTIEIRNRFFEEQKELLEIAKPLL